MLRKSPLHHRSRLDAARDLDEAGGGEQVHRPDVERRAVVTLSPGVVGIALERRRALRSRPVDGPGDEGTRHALAAVGARHVEAHDRPRGPVVAGIRRELGDR